MNCPKCSGKVRVRRVFATDGGKTQEYFCTDCQYRFTVVAMIFDGMSAFKASKALAKGEIEIRVRKPLA